MRLSRLSLAWALVAAAAACAPQPSAGPQPLSLPSPTTSAAPLGSAPPLGSASPEPNEPPDQLVAPMLAVVEKARQLPAKKRVASQTLDRRALLAQVRSHVEKDVPREVVRGQGELLVAYGLIPPSYDYEKGVFDLLEAQLAGYYEPADKTMYLAQDLTEDDAEATLAHELVHALQDQYYDLGPKLEYKPDSGDVSSAVHALAEGDAMSAMMDVMLLPKGINATSVPDESLASSMSAQMMNAPATRSVPPVLKAALVAPYIDGMLFVHALRRRGGWGEVDKAWRSPPTTTEQLLHLEKYDAREPPLAVPPPPKDALGGGWDVAFSDVFGEQSLKIALESMGDRRAAASAAAGWGGDRVAILRRARQGGDEIFATWWTRFDGNPAACREASEAYEFLAKAVASGKRHGRNATVCRERSDLGPMTVGVHGCDVLVTAGPYLREGDKRSSSGKCSEVSGWVSRRLSSP